MDGTCINIFFDMDGTMVDLYGVKKWLSMLRQERTTPFSIAKPLYDVDVLHDVLQNLHNLSHIKLFICTKTPPGSPRYTVAVQNAKLQWLDKYNLLHYFNKVIFCPYRGEKFVHCHPYTKNSYNVIVDDDVRQVTNFSMHLYPDQLFTNYSQSTLLTNFRRNAIL